MKLGMCTSNQATEILLSTPTLDPYLGHLQEFSLDVQGDSPPASISCKHTLRGLVRTKWPPCHKNPSSVRSLPSGVTSIGSQFGGDHRLLTSAGNIPWWFVMGAVRDYA